MLHINIKKILPAVFCLLGIFPASVRAQLADVTIVTEPATNSAGNNGKMTITIDPASATAPYTISVTGPAPYTFNTVTSNPVTVLTALRSGNYSGTIVDNNGCTAFFTAKVQKCKIMSMPGGGSAVTCLEVAEPGPGGPSAEKFYATGTTSGGVVGVVAPSAYTFQVYHALPEYLYDQISPSVDQAMITEINNLALTDYSPYEILEQNEFESDAPYIFSFNSDGSLIWVYRNLDADIFAAAPGRESAETTEKRGSLYPNPTSGVVNVPVGKMADARNVFYMVVNSVGQTALSNTAAVAEGMENFSIDLGEMPAGLYFIRVTDRDGESDIFTVSKL